MIGTNSHDEVRKTRVGLRDIFWFFCFVLICFGFFFMVFCFFFFYITCNKNIYSLVYFVCIFFFDSNKKFVEKKEKNILCLKKVIEKIHVCKRNENS